MTVLKKQMSNTPVTPISERKHQILLIAGDYDVIHCVRRSLPPARFEVHTAFNHREAVYSLKNERFDALIVDAAMHDRHTSISTIGAMAEMGRGLPLVAFALTDQAVGDAQRATDDVVDVLDQQETYLTVMRALNVPVVREEISIQPPGPDNSALLTKQMDEISTLFDLSKSLTEVLDLSEVLNRVVEAARHLTEAEEGMILMPEGEELYLRAKVGIEVEQARNFRIKMSDNLAGDVFRTGKPTLIGTSGPKKLKTEYFVNSLLYVPISVNNRVIGVLGVNNRTKEDSFDIHHQQLLTNLASFAAVAIENARIHQESLNRSKELETLVAASQVVNSSLAMDETLPNICKQLANVLNVGYSEIYIWNRKDNCITTLARFYQTAWRFGHGPSVELTQHAALRQSLEKDMPRMVTIRDKEFRAEAEYLRQVGAEGMLVVPVCTNGQVMGAVRVFYTNLPEDPIEDEAIDYVHNIALEGLVNLLSRTDRIMSENMLVLAEDINRSLESDWCELALMKRGNRALTVLTRIGTGVWLSPPYSSVELAHYQDLQQALDSQTIVHRRVSEQAISPGVRALIERTQSRTLLGLPLIQRGKTVGMVIFADTERDRSFNQREINMAKAIVGQAATALENNNLVRSLEQSLQDLKNAQDRLVQAARLSAMGELAAVVAHQINNPLTTIIVDAELMLMDEEPGSPYYDSLLAIQRTGKRAANVARRLLAIARPTDTQAVPEPIDVVDTVRGILSLMQNHIERASVRVIADLPNEPLPPVMAVKGRLDDIWLNLMVNANDALSGQDGGKIGIEVHYEPGDRYINVIVWDNGPGIPEKIKQQIFSPFFTTKPVGEGTGLGLHICREVVENVGGTIEVESVQGEFTRFLVKLPIAVHAVPPGTS